jgi:hypothetical protein
MPHPFAPFAQTKRLHNVSLKSRVARGNINFCAATDGNSQAGLPSSRRTCGTSLSASGSSWDSRTDTTAEIARRTAN